MVLFYTDNIQGNLATFTEDECRHINNALRKRSGDEIHFIDGEGNQYTGSIIDISKRKATVKVITKQEVKSLSPYLHIAIAPTKNMDRIEWFLEKSIEIGVNEISLIQCKHSERKQVKMDRLHRIMIAACKQSMKARFPIINELQSFESWLDSEKNTEVNYIACLIEDTKPLKNIYDGKQDISICIGPEGGFRDNEIELAVSKGFSAVSLGDQRLRTETAGLFAVATARVIS